MRGNPPPLTRETGATAVYITHDQSEAFALADVIGVLDHGTATDCEHVVVQVGDRRLRSRTVGAVRVGEVVSVPVRPAATTILRPGTAAPHGSLPGTVTDVAYRGRGYDHVVAGPAGTLSAVFDPCSQPRGSDVDVDVALDPDGCVAYPTGARVEPQGYPTKVTAVSIAS